MRAVIAALAVAAVGTGTTAQADPGAYAYPFSCNPDSLSADFAQRDQAPETEAPESTWYAQDAHGSYLNDGWGPRATALPPVAVPDGSGCDAPTWRRERVVATALHYLNEPGNPQALQYRHHHIPDWDPPSSTQPLDAAPDDPEHAGSRSAQTWAGGRGLDCSNFTAWVYNYGLGIGFGGNVHRQYDGTAGPMGQRLPPDGPFEPGDLIYLHPVDDPTVASHVVIYLDDEHIVDSRIDAQGVMGVQVRRRVGWYRNTVLGGWRPTG